MIDDDFLNENETVEEDVGEPQVNPEVAAFIGAAFDQSSLDIMTLLEGGSAFNRTLETTLGDVSGGMLDINQTIAQLGTLVNPIDPSIVAQITGVGTTVNAALSNVSQFTSHVANVFDSLPDRLATFSSHQGLKNALAQAPQSCDEMSSFFGSITSMGQTLVGEISSTASSILQTVNDFRALAVELQTLVAETQTSIENAINAEIALTADPSRITMLTNLLTTIQNDFGNSSSDEREALIDGLTGIIPESSIQTINGFAGPMWNADFDIAGLANKAEGEATLLSGDAASLAGIIAGETSLMANAEGRLLKFAQASSIRSMFKGDACVNTILGFVGSDSLLKKLF